VDVNAIVRRTTQILASSEEEGAIELKLQPDLPRAHIDAEKLRQVLINLIQNALQAMNRRGTVTLTTRTRRGPGAWSSGEPGDSWLEISVADQGPGISKKVLKNLFVPFFTTKDTGTGLGLAISQRIIQSAGGSIDVWTQEGEGTTFSILLPAGLELPPGPDPQSPSATTTPTPSPAGQP
jgi:signal transduction histidine kinase